MKDGGGGPVIIRTLSFTLLREFGQGVLSDNRTYVLFSGVRRDVTDFGYVFEGAGLRRWQGKLLAESLEPSFGR